MTTAAAAAAAVAAVAAKAAAATTTTTTTKANDETHLGKQVKTVLAPLMTRRLCVCTSYHPVAVRLAALKYQRIPGILKTDDEVVFSQCERFEQLRK